MHMSGSWRNGKNHMKLSDLITSFDLYPDKIVCKDGENGIQLILDPYILENRKLLCSMSDREVLSWDFNNSTAHGTLRVTLAGQEFTVGIDLSMEDR